MVLTESRKKNTDLVYRFILSFLFIIVILSAGCTDNPASSPSVPLSNSSRLTFTPTPFPAEAVIPATSAVTPAPGNQRDRNILVIKNIVEEYHKTHTYNLPDMYACAQMSQDVWDMVETRGINATIGVGKIDGDITSIQDADHAWVLAEIAPGENIAMETTGGYLVCSFPGICAVNNPRYYKGWIFTTPKKLQDYLKNGPCTPGYIPGNDSQCHPACGGDAYCTDNAVCVNGECRGCDTGYVFGQDLQCHPVCGSGTTYCTGNAICINGECRSCNPGYVFGQDLQCHLACGDGNSYCAGNDVCVNGRCISCGAGYYLGTDLQCHKS
jgi:hypothetical protein